ncbi:hypothetical protein ACSLBF_19830 (plasmid) [Pseudoalteromonas sp. T1lg65]|uniref:hypothetical protein n=1 Tax=Pseudoalteromonas sp. T1lg65 TaxID=2077101 RepID=UPI003F795AFC
MNAWIFGAGIVGVLTACVHVFAGQIDPVRPFLKTSLATVPKATLLACWHMVSVMLLIPSLLVAYIGWYQLDTLYSLVIFISAMFLAFASVFIFVGWHFFKWDALARLPQWSLLLTIGALGLYGSMWN